MFFKGNFKLQTSLGESIVPWKMCHPCFFAPPRKSRFFFGDEILCPSRKQWKGRKRRDQEIFLGIPNGRWIPPHSLWSRCPPRKDHGKAFGAHVRKSLASSKSWPEWTQSNNGAQLAGQVCLRLPSKAGSSKEMQASAEMSSRMSSSRSFKMDACLKKGDCFLEKRVEVFRSRPGAMVVFDTTLHYIET